MSRNRSRVEPRPYVVAAGAPAFLPPPPEHLSPAMASWWREVTDIFELDQHDLLRLQTAAESWDRMVEARRAIAENGLTFTDPKGMLRSRPEIAIERDSRTSFLRALRELDLGGAVEAPRPPGLRGNRG